MSIRLSVITTSYNSEKTIEDTIISVLAQNYSDIEYLVIDGGSTDGTIEIVEKYLPDKRITFVSERDDGLWDAMNKGVNLSSGEFVCFLNSDDVFSSNEIISKSMLFIELNSLDFMFGFVDMFDHKLSRCYRKYRVQSLDKAMLEKGVMPAHPGSIVRRSLFLKNGSFRYNLNVPPDFFFMLSLLVSKDQIKIKCFKTVLVKMRAGGIGNSSISYRIQRQFKIINALKLVGFKVFILRYVFGKFNYRIREYFD